MLSAKSKAKTFHCTIPQKIKLEEIDPSLAIGFYFEHEEEFTLFCETQTQINDQTDFPLFSVQ